MTRALESHLLHDPDPPHTAALGKNKVTKAKKRNLWFPFTLPWFVLNRDNGTVDDMNGVLGFSLFSCSGGREQLVLVSSSRLPLPLPFPDSTAGSVCASTLGLRPTQCLSQYRPWWVECLRLRGLPRFSPSFWATSAIS